MSDFSSLAMSETTREEVILEISVCLARYRASVITTSAPISLLRFSMRFQTSPGTIL